VCVPRVWRGLWRHSARSEELESLHQVHILLFGEVRTGVGMDVLHLHGKHPKRQAYAAAQAALQVRCRPPSPHAISSLLLASPTPIVRPIALRNILVLLGGVVYAVPGLLVWRCACVCAVQDAAKRGQFGLVVRFLGLLWLRRMRASHSWLSALVPPLDVVLEVSQPQRVAVLTAAVLVNMAFCAVFLGRNPANVPHVAATGLVAAVRGGWSYG
jgi:hypothetical protein